MCETKRCAHCGRELPVSLFCKSRKTKDGLQPWCKPCTNEYAREKHAKDRAEREALQERLFTTAKEAVEAAPDASTVVTKDGRVLHKVSEGCKPLCDYTPRELLAELKSRGYVWENMWVKTGVDYSKI